MPTGSRLTAKWWSELPFI